MPETLITPIFTFGTLFIAAALARGILHDAFGIGSEPEIRMGDFPQEYAPIASRRQRFLWVYPVMLLMLIAFGAIALGSFPG